MNELVPLEKLANHCPPGKWQQLVREWLDANRNHLRSMRPLSDVIDEHVQGVLRSTETVEEAASILGINASTIYRRGYTKLVGILMLIATTAIAQPLPFPHLAGSNDEPDSVTRIQWTASPYASGYYILFGSNSMSYYVAHPVGTNFLDVVFGSEPAYLNVIATNRAGQWSDYSAELVINRPTTNVFTIASVWSDTFNGPPLGTNWISHWTNSLPGTSRFYSHTIERNEL